MIISPISSVPTPALQGTAQATTALNLDRLSALSQSSAISNNASLLDAIRNNSSNITVDVSRLGELLAYTAKLQIQQAANASGTGGVNRTDATQTKEDLAQLTAIATSFVDAFNQLQASNSSLSDNPLIASASDSLLQAMNTGAQNADGNSLFGQLAEIGIKLQNTALPGSDSFLTLDVTSFQNALAKDRSATLALLTQALQVLGSAESTVIAQNQELASGNIQTNTNQTQNTNTMNSINASTNVDTISGTTATSNLNANAVNPSVTSTVTSAFTPAITSTNIPSTNTDVLLQQTLVDEALLAAIGTARNTQASANTDVPSTVTANVVGNTAQAISANPASSATRAAELPASNNAVSASQVNAPGNVTSHTVGNIAANAGSNATLTTQALDQNTGVNISAADAGKTTSAVSTTADKVAGTLPQSLNAETPAETTTLTTPQTPPTEIIDTSATAQAKTVTESKLPANITTPSSVLTESQLENQIAASSIKSNENAVSTTMPSNAQTALNSASTFAEVSKTLATINQASAAAINLAAGNQTLPANPASTAVASAVTSNNSTLPTPVSNSAALNANAMANSIQDGINPLISVAVAAYRVRDIIQANTTEKPRTTQTDAVTATEAVTGVEPVKLDLHEHSKNQRHDAEADSAYHVAEELGEPEKNAEVAGNINVNI